MVEYQSEWIHKGIQYRIDIDSLGSTYIGYLFKNDEIIYKQSGDLDSVVDELMRLRYLKYSDPDTIEKYKWYLEVTKGFNMILDLDGFFISDYDTYHDPVEVFDFYVSPLVQLKFLQYRRNLNTNKFNINSRYIGEGRLFRLHDDYMRCTKVPDGMKLVDIDFDTLEAQYNDVICPFGTPGSLIKLFHNQGIVHITQDNIYVNGKLFESIKG